MTDAAAPTPKPVVRKIAWGDIHVALGEGWSDFRKAPSFGLFFSLVYVLGGVIIYLQLAVWGQIWWIIPVALGFPVLGPFLAVGLYEVSRRIEAGEAIDWASVLGVVYRQRDRQVPSMAVWAIMVFLAWMYLAHLIFALFFGLSAITQFDGSFAFILSTEGLMMTVIGTAVGAALSLALFSTTVIGLPLVLDREIDVISAMIASVSAVRENPGPLIGWGVLAGAAMILAMLPLFIGLFVVLPVLGHATWRLYRRVVIFPDS